MSRSGSVYSGRRSRIATGESRGRTSFSYRDNRARSPSPTEYYRQQRSRLDHIHNQVFELNVFIYQGIDKFLDKQAVRDLIAEYEAEDIYEGGAELYFAQLDSEMIAANGAVASKRLFRSAIFNAYQTSKIMTKQKRDAAQQNEGPTTSQKRKSGGLWTIPRSTLWNVFFSAIRIKSFNSRRNSRRSGASVQMNSSYDRPVQAIT